MVDYAKLSVTSCNFTACSAASYGGAACWDYGDDYNPPSGPFFTSCIFCDNSATYAPDFCMNAKSAVTTVFSECITYNSVRYPSGYVIKHDMMSGEHSSPTSTLTSSNSVTIQPCNTEGETVLKVDQSGLTLFTLSDQRLTLKGFSIAVSSGNCLFRANETYNYLTPEPMRIYPHGVIVVFVTDVFGNCLSGQAPLS